MGWSRARPRGSRAGDGGGAEPDRFRGTMSEPAAGANASPCVVASRRSAGPARAADGRPSEEEAAPPRGRRGGRGGRRRSPSVPPQSEAAGPREPPLSFEVKSERVGAVIGEIAAAGKRPAAPCCSPGGFRAHLGGGINFPGARAVARRYF